MLWVVYTTAYIGRANYAASIVTIIKQGIFTNTQAGLIGTIYFFCYGGWQLVNGMITDKVSPFKIILIGLTGSAVANIFMGLNSNYVVMAVIWGLNGILQAMIWAPVLYIISNIIHSDLRYKACLYIASTFPVGTLIAYFLAMICSNLKWNYVFFMSASIMFIVVFLFFLTYKKVNKLLTYREVSSNEKTKEPSNKINIKLSKLLVISGVSLVIVAVMLHGMLKEGIMTWVPTMISETYQTTPAFSIFITMILPIINLGGAFISTFIFEKLTKRNEVLSSLFIMGFAVLPLSVILFIGEIPLAVSIVMLSLTTVSMSAFNHIYMTLAPLRFKNYNRTATITGIFNSVTYLGCATANFGFGWLSNIFGWRNSVFFWIGIAVIAVFFCMISLKNWKKFTQNLDEEI